MEKNKEDGVENKKRDCTPFMLFALEEREKRMEQTIVETAEKFLMQPVGPSSNLSDDDCSRSLKSSNDGMQLQEPKMDIAPPTAACDSTTTNQMSTDMKSSNDGVQLHEPKMDIAPPTAACDSTATNQMSTDLLENAIEQEVTAVKMNCNVSEEINEDEDLNFLRGDENDTEEQTFSNTADIAVDAVQVVSFMLYDFFSSKIIFWTFRFIDFSCIPHSCT